MSYYMPAFYFARRFSISRFSIARSFRFIFISSLWHTKFSLISIRCVVAELWRYFRGHPSGETCMSSPNIEFMIFLALDGSENTCCGFLNHPTFPYFSFCMHGEHKDIQVSDGPVELCGGWLMPTSLPLFRITFCMFSSIFVCHIFFSVAVFS